MLHQNLAGEPSRMNLSDQIIIAPEVDAPTIGRLVEEPFRPSDVYLGSQLNRVEVRGGLWCKTGIKLVNTWNASLVDCCVTGALGDEAEYANPQIMQIGIDVGNSMDCHIIRPRVTSAATGIFAGDPGGPIRAEGLHIEGGYVMHCHTAIHLVGHWLGGWPTPAVWIERLHLNYSGAGVVAFAQSFLQIRAVNFYASQYSQRQWAIYLVGCKHVVIDGNQLWANRHGFYGGIVLDNCEDVAISGGTLSADLSIALHALPNCRNVTTEGKTWERAAAQGKVVNRAAA